MSASKKLEKNQIVEPLIEVVALALRSSADGKYLLARRGPGGSGAGAWEFPGGKIETGESQKQALRREILEELSFDIAPYDLCYIGSNLHHYSNSNTNIRIYLWRAEAKDKPIFKLVDHDSAKWYSINEIKEIDLSEADMYFISLI